MHTVVLPDYGPRYARNTQKLTKYTENKLCVMLVFLYTKTSLASVHFRSRAIPGISSLIVLS